jgi:hypothetical protein
MDAYVKTVLTVIAACLLLQVAQGFGLAGSPGSGQTESSSAERFMVQAVPMARILLRFDRTTGETWTMSLQRNQPRVWTPVEQAPPEMMAPEAGEGAAAPAGAAEE